MCVVYIQELCQSFSLPLMPTNIFNLASIKCTNKMDSSILYDNYYYEYLLNGYEHI